MRAALTAVAAAGVIVLVLVLGSAIVTAVDPIARAEAQHEAQLRQAQREALAPAWLWVKRIGLGAVAVTLLAGAAAALAGALIAWTGVARARNQAALVYAQHGLYPAVVQPAGGANLLLSAAASPAITLLPPVNEPRAQIVAALTNGNLDRIPAGAMRPVLRPTPDEALLPEPEPALTLLPAAAAVDVDPVTRPHWLIVGQTGSGKSTATRYIMAQLAERHPVEFLICEPGGVDWNTAAAATSESGIAECIDVTWRELERRQETLRSEDVPHVSALRQRLPYLYLVIEEMESVLDNLRDLSRTQATAARVALRNIARLGRKTGIGLIAVTQAARTDVFDSHVRTNLANVLLFRNSQTTAEMFRVSHVRLADLPTGQAYSLAHGGLVTFPRTDRPAVPLSPLYTGAVREPVEPWSAGETAATPDPTAVQPIPVPQSDPEEWLIQRIWRAYLAADRNLSAAQRAVFGYDGGRAYYVARYAVVRMEAQR